MQTLRRAIAADAPMVAQIIRAAFLEFRALYTAGGFEATTPSPEVIRERLPQGPTWLAFCDDNVVGTVSAVRRGNRLYLRSMAVLPSSRGQRVGAALLEVVERFGATEGVTSIYLSTTPFLHAAIRLYEGFGFRRTEEGPHHLFGTPLFTMEKNLAG